MMYQLKFVLAFGLMWVCNPAIFAVNQPVFITTAPFFTCPDPSISVKGSSSGTLSFEVSSGGGTVQYYFVRQESGMSSAIQSAANGTLDVSGLPAGTYIFFFRSVCGGAQSEWFKTEDLILG